MKILHLSDLHIGKKVNDFSMIESQKHVLNQAIDLIKNEDIKALLIAGDVFDKPIPSLQALEVFNSFLEEVCKCNLKIFIISGNHDNLERLSYLSSFLKKADIYISKNFDGTLESYQLTEDINIFLMPYLYPALIRKYYPNETIESYNDAFRVLIKNTNIDNKKTNILLAHQFVIGSDSLITSDSEQKSVGGVDCITYELFNDFDYTALGHLHCPQKAGLEKIRYAGSPLKYSFSEINQKKSFTIVDIKAKNDIKISLIPITPLYEMKEYIGYIDEFLDKNFYSTINQNDFIHFILKDEAVLDAKKKLSMIYPNIMLLEFDNSFTKNLNNIEFKGNLKSKSIFEHFCDFYYMQYNQKPDSKKEKIIKDIVNSLNKEAI